MAGLSHLYDSLEFLARHFARAHHWRNTGNGPRCIKEALKRRHLEEHLMEGKAPVGLAFVAPGESTTRAALLDLDDHGGRLGWDGVIGHTKAIVSQLRANDYMPHVFRSGGGKGVHILILWKEPQDAYSVRCALKDALSESGCSVGAKGLDHEQVEVFPKQNNVAEGSYGSMAILPLSRESLPLDENFNVQEPDIVESVAYWQYSPPVTPRERPTQPAQPATKGGEGHVASSAEQKRLTAALSTISADCGYDEWLQVLMAIHYEWDGSNEGASYARDWSATSDKYNAEIFDQKWASFGRGDNPTTGGTILKMAREAGGEDDVSSMFEALPPENTLEGISAENTLEGINTKPARAMLHAKNIQLRSNWNFPYVIKGWLPEGADAQLFGETGIGKTFVGLDMGARVAAGLPWFGHKVKKTPVLVVLYEGILGVELRLAAIKANHPDWPWADMAFAVQPATAPLNSQIGADQLKAAVQTFRSEYGIAPGMLVIDTYSRALGTDTSKEEEVIKLNTFLGGLRESRSDLTVLCVHHPGHGDVTRGRGSYAIEANLDVNIRVEEGKITAPKQRDYRASEAIGFELKLVELGTDQDGDALTSCAVAEADVPTAQFNPKGAWQTAVWNVSLAGEYSNADQLAEAAIEFRGLESDYRTRERAKRAAKDLIEQGAIVVFEDENDDLY